jgi:peptidoglycan-associated lipoprotein
VKYNLWSEYRQNPAAIAIRAIAKIPTGKVDAGASTGKPDVGLDLIVSKEAAKLVDVSGFGGYEFRGSPDGIDAPTGAFRWGAGVAFPSRNPLRISGELNGQVPSKDVATITGTSIVGTDLTRAPVTSNTENMTRATLGLTFQSKKGFFAGAGISWNVPSRARSSAFTDEADVIGDYYDMQFRIGYHPASAVRPRRHRDLRETLRTASKNRAPKVRARCEPCTVEVGKTSTVTGDAQDPDGDTLAYRWSAPAGRFANQSDRQTIWTAPMQEGPVPATITVDDGKGGTASDSVTIQVVRGQPVVELNFEDVFFDFDRSTLRPEALRLLDDAVARLQANPDKNIVIERSHLHHRDGRVLTLALGDRRANSVKEYLTSRGVPASRLETRSYGEERPKFDNAREETRRMNRRAALVVKVQ